jgi:hypothetical protein
MIASFRSAIGSPWTEMEPVRVGRVPPGKGTPDVFVIAEENDEPFLRIDVYDLAPEQSPFAECIAWKHWIVIGIGHHLYLIPLTADDPQPWTSTLTLDTYTHSTTVCSSRRAKDFFASRPTAS